MITIDYQSRDPIYEQIVERFQMLILTGALPAGSQMPSVRALAMELSINPNTIQKAFAVLEQQGYIFSVKGRGSYVAESDRLIQQKRESCITELTGLLTHALEIGVPENNLHELITQVYHKEVSHD